MSTPTIKVTITEPSNAGCGQDEPPMLVREFSAPNEPVTCYPGSGYRSRDEERQPTSTAQQLEGFLRGAGYELPSFIRLGTIEPQLAVARRDEARAEELRKTNEANAARWRAYAELLEKKIRKAGLRVPKGRP